MTLFSAAARRTSGRVLKAMRGLGLDIRPAFKSNGQFSGIRFDWSPDEHILRGSIRNFRFQDQYLRFFINDDRDVIQSHHLQGKFYEADELAIIARHFNDGCFVDVGANVGNHSIFAGKILGAAKVIAFEPPGLAADILDVNVSLNDLQAIVELHRCGLSDQAGNANLFSPYNSNLGGNRLVAQPDGAIPLRRGDDLIDRADFIKIDTEGFEIAVLNGLTATIERDRPILFVEVENENDAAFRAFCDRVSYRIEQEFRRYGTATNYLARPVRAETTNAAIDPKSAA